MIRIGLEIQCLPYAGFLSLALYNLSKLSGALLLKKKMCIFIMVKKCKVPYQCEQNVSVYSSRSTV